ncbi:hypothetical protein [Psychroserpens ponticola]|uniref:Uncharacterized protein n=1 Tax=Psychroserpens ponticola TaxID=2932268 RepID=A0ABY7RZM8_9FLAO|nr:hypothetical protein [Psychroserpens ponticola]WCO02594.1 hypothetical protein MUN68_003645 [Psychroserpens ponticola]
MKNYLKKANQLIVLIGIIICQSCSTDDGTSTSTINPGNDPNFTIVANSESSTLPTFNRKVIVFGVDIYAASGVEDAKLLHAVNIMAQYLDNDEDGVVDNQLVVDKMIENNAFLFMWKTENDHPSDVPTGREGQDLGADETVPAWHTNGHTGSFDASLEEVWHIINVAGHANAYPTVFGLEAGSELANAMDIARGGYFETIPNPYPSTAWYTYDDATCEYADCMTIEYMYWSMSSILGAQENRLSEIQQEWKPNTNALMQTTDVAMYALLTDPQYSFPTVLPDGTYRQ